ncbi:hypothetical protein PoB_005245000 [Plakobranchus ocellatus]|uniref:Secreted protein n=1 Tax=Plakobranchus ocellatus TaxID=259542 RepID=A0AAV4BZU8_9GAST|nr:hypothetical protein PoB_005245000 [Plakobranchus ocellatus]
MFRFRSSPFPPGPWLPQATLAYLPLRCQQAGLGGSVKATGELKGDQWGYCTNTSGSFHHQFPSLLIKLAESFECPDHNVASFRRPHHLPPPHP